MSVCGEIISIFYKASLMVIMSQRPLRITGYPIIMDCPISLPDLSAVAGLKPKWFSLGRPTGLGSCGGVLPFIRYARAHTKYKAPSCFTAHQDWHHLRGGVVLCTALNSGRSQDQVNHYGS